jgi:hypothetical protein
MPVTPENRGGVLPEQERAELEAVLSSHLLSRAPSLGRMLRYICQRYFDGEAQSIKEYSIAVEALDRPAEFDPKEDAIVRVEAYRLRKRLKQFYDGEGASHQLQIVIPPGQYVPQFFWREEAAIPEIPGPDLKGAPIGERANAVFEGDKSEVSVEAAPANPPALKPFRPPRPGARIRFSTGSRWGWLAAALTLLIVLGVSARQQIFLGSVPSAHPEGTAAANPLRETRIMAGSSRREYIDRMGHVWTGDRYFTGGLTFDVPGQTITRTADPELFRSRREGEFRYDIPVAQGIYELRLYFAETYFGEGNRGGGGESSRLFNIVVNGTAQIGTFDVIADAGGSNAATVKIFTDVEPAPDGFLHLSFEAVNKSVNASAILNGIEIVPGIPGKMRPIRIIAQQESYRDSGDQLWGSDRYYSSGYYVKRTQEVSGAKEPQLFRGERYGNFTYAIPVAATGSYTVNLHFAETWFGTANASNGGHGSRIFDLYFNGMALLRNFDIYKEAGGPDRAVIKSFRGLRPNGQGKLVFSFVPSMNYACVNAIEVVDEGAVAVKAGERGRAD